MQVVVFATDSQRTEWFRQESERIIWINYEREFAQHASADAFVDLQYTNTGERNALLAQLLPRPVLVNSVIPTLQETNSSFTRFNGWATFLSSPITEASANLHNRAAAEAVFSVFGKKPEWLADEPGFITARVVSMIINEAYLALAEGVSTKEEIDTAMKLGTAYPYGPFEWAEKIGLQQMAALLKKLSQTQARYTPAGLLLEEAGSLT